MVPNILRKENKPLLKIKGVVSFDFGRMMFGLCAIYFKL